MAVIRVNKTRDYVVMSNSHFKEKDMSLKAKGLLSEMLSLPDDWDYSIAGLAAINKENETAIKSALEELKKFGYLKVTKIMPENSPSGRIEYVYDIFENKKQGVGFLGVEILGVENQGLENQGQLNINNKILNNKNINNNIPHLNKKETKPKISYAEYVSMQEKEYLSLVDKYGETFTRRCIEILNNYKGACGKKYKSDYLAILNWVVARTEQEGIRKEPKVAQKTDKDIEAEIKRLQEKNNSQYLY